MNESRKEYYEENKEKFKDRSKKYRLENQDKCIAQSKKYYEENKERIKERCKERARLKKIEDRNEVKRLNEENEKLRVALRAIKAHQETLIEGPVMFKLSTTWHIANKALNE